MLLLFNKPYGVLCQFRSVEGKLTLKDFIAQPGVHAAGRLDADSEGLLVLTDDGGEQNRTTDPRHKLPKLDGVAIVRPQRRGFAIRGVGVIGRPSICT